MTLSTTWSRWFAWHPVRIGGRLIWLRHVWRQDGADPDPRRCWTKYRRAAPRLRAVSPITTEAVLDAWNKIGPQADEGVPICSRPDFTAGP